MTLLSSLEKLEDEISTPRQIAIRRMQYLGVSAKSNFDDDCPSSSDTTSEMIDGGLPMVLVSLLQSAFDIWSVYYQSILSTSKSQTTLQICNAHQIINLQRTIQLLIKVSQLDVTLSEEIKRSGLQLICSRLITQINKLTGKLIEYDSYTEENEDTLVLLQDLVFELYTPSGNNESSNMAFTNDELISRLPLVYNLMPVSSDGSNDNADHEIQQRPHEVSVFINQISKRQSAQVDVGYVMWPSAIILSRWLISNPHVIKDKTVLELGAGCGLVGIVAARILSSQKKDRRIEEEDSQHVIITDVNELVIENIQQNINLNDVSSVACVAKLDFYVQTGTNHSGKWIASEMNMNRSSTSADDDSKVGENIAAEDIESEDTREPVDIILAADIICQPSDSVAASKTIYDALKPGGVAYVVCANSKHRFGVEIFASECEARGLDVTSTNVSDMYEGELLSDLQLHTAAGYIEGMTLTFFEITK